MEFDNDNSPPAPETSRVLPVLGRVEPDGRVVLRPSATPRPDPQAWSPNDPREA
jgi:hypothetical protein